MTDPRLLAPEAHAGRDLVAEGRRDEHHPVCPLEGEKHSGLSQCPVTERRPGAGTRLLEPGINARIAREDDETSRNTGIRGLANREEHVRATVSDQTWQFGLLEPPTFP